MRAMGSSVEWAEGGGCEATGQPSFHQHDASCTPIEAQLKQLTASGIPTEMPQAVQSVVASRARDGRLEAVLNPRGGFGKGLDEGSRVERDAESGSGEVTEEEGVEACARARGKTRRGGQDQSARVGFRPSRATALVACKRKNGTHQL